MVADAEFYAKQRELQAKKDAEAMKATAEYWKKYREESAKIAENNRPSKLNFGLI